MGAVACTTGVCQSDADDTDDEDEEGGSEVASPGLHGEGMPNLRRCITVFSGASEAPFAVAEDGCIADIADIVVQTTLLQASETLADGSRNALLLQPWMSWIRRVGALFQLVMVHAFDCFMFVCACF